MEVKTGELQKMAGKLGGLERERTRLGDEMENQESVLEDLKVENGELQVFICLISFDIIYISFDELVSFLFRKQLRTLRSKYPILDDVYKS
jgi:hypothetical protein